MPLVKQNKKNIKNKSRKTFLQKIKTPRGILISVLLVGFASFGAWKVFYANAEPNNCTDTSGGQICDVDQASNGNGTDALVAIGDEPKSLQNAGWTYYGAAFRAPKFPQNGAVPIYRIARDDITIHDLVYEKDVDWHANNGWRNEGLRFYGWTDARQPGTVPIWKMSRGGLYFAVLWTTDKAWADRTVAADSSWRVDGPAFYAYPPTDCSKSENFYTNACAGPRQNLTNPVTIPAPAPAPAPKPTSTPSPKPAPSSPSSAPQPITLPPAVTAAAPAIEQAANQGNALNKDCNAPNPSPETTQYCIGRLDSVALATSKPRSSGVECGKDSSLSPSEASYCLGLIEGSGDFNKFVTELQRQQEEAAKLTAYSNAVTAAQNNNARQALLDAANQQRIWNTTVERDCSNRNRVTLYNNAGLATGCSNEPIWKIVWKCMGGTGRILKPLGTATFPKEARGGEEKNTALIFCKGQYPGTRDVVRVY